MARRFAKAVIVGASITAVFTVSVQLAAVVFGHGESAVGWMLIVPWFTIFIPGFFVAKFVGWDWRVGSVYEVTAAIFTFMTFVNASIGALFGWAVTAVYCLFRRDA